MSRSNKKSNYKETPSSPSMKRSLTRKGSTEKVSKGGSSKKRQLKRSSTAPTKGGRGSPLRNKNNSPKSKSRSGSPSLSANKKRLQQKNNKNHSSSSGGGGNSRSKKGGGSSNKQSWKKEEEIEETKMPPKKQKPSAMSKCMKSMCGSHSLVGDWEVTSEMATRTVAKLLLKTSDLITLRKSFEIIDIDESGEIDYDEFLEHMEERRNTFTDAVFRLIDENGDGVLEFGEFVSICGSFCMWNRGEILKFCFDTFDADGGGTIDEEEFEALAKTISHKDPTFPGNFQKALEEFDTNGDGLIDMDEFATLNQRYPMVLFPMFRLQDKMQRCTLGLGRWNQIMKEQYKLIQIREYRLTHAGDLPPESCMSKMFRCGAGRLGGEEDFADLEERAKVAIQSNKKNGIKPKK